MAEKPSQKAVAKAAKSDQPKAAAAATDQRFQRGPAEGGGKPILLWQAKEFAEYSRNKRWYLIVGVIGALLVAGALVLQQWLVAVVFLLATYVVIRHADDAPRTLTYSINKLGVQVGDKFHPYNELRTFWVIYNPPAKTLTLQTVKRLKPLIKIHLADVDPLSVKNVLKQYLPEETKQREDFLDKFSRLIRL